MSLDLTLHEIRTAVSGKILHQGGNETSYSSFSSDSRKIERNGIFLCIPGTQVDGHDFAPQAANSGCSLILGQNETKLRALTSSNPNVSIILIQDALMAIQDLAKYYRSKFQIPVVGLTGSSGKTTTKDLIASIALAKSPEHALITEGTLNNHWGVPQMVLRLNSKHHAAVFEMGMSDFGEIRALAEIARPAIGYITTIGPAHLEKLGSIEGVLKAKRELFDWIEEHVASGLLLINIDDPLLRRTCQEIRPSFRSKILTLSTQEKADYQLLKSEPLIEESRFGWTFQFGTPSGTIDGTLPLPGRHNLTNALAASALSLEAEIGGKSEIKAGLAQPKISSLRSDIFRLKNGATVYNDSYNANPTSVSALFETARMIQNSSSSQYEQIIAAVGDMLELGPTANELHREMGKKAAECGVTTLLSLGHHRQHWLEGYKNTGRQVESRAFEDHDSLIRDLLHRIEQSPRTLVLIKGSRGAKMDLIAARLK